MNKMTSYHDWDNLSLQTKPMQHLDGPGVIAERELERTAMRGDKYIVGNEEFTEEEMKQLAGLISKRIIKVCRCQECAYHRPGTAQKKISPRHYVSSASSPIFDIYTACHRCKEAFEAPRSRSLCDPCAVAIVHGRSKGKQCICGKHPILGNIVFDSSLLVIYDCKRCNGWHWHKVWQQIRDTHYEQWQVHVRKFVEHTQLHSGCHKECYERNEIIQAACEEAQLARNATRAWMRHNKVTALVSA